MVATCRKAGGVAIVAHRGEVTMGAEHGLGICIYDLYIYIHGLLIMVDDGYIMMIYHD